MNPALIITVTSLFFLLLFSLSLFAFIVIRRMIIERRQVRFQRLYGKIESDVLEAISLLDPDFTLKVAREWKRTPRVLTKVLLDFGEVIVGEGRVHLQIIFNKTVRNLCLRRLRSRRLSQRLQSARLFVVFFDPADHAHLLRLLDDKPIVRLAVISALARNPSAETLKYIFEAFERDPGTTVRSYFNIMFSLGNRIEPQVRASFNKSLSPEKLGLLVELAGAIPLRPLNEEIKSLAGHPDKEIRIKVARALGKLLLPDSAETLVSLVSDEAWEVQAQAVKSLGRLKDRRALGLLTRSLFSPSWYVRHNAAYGLAEMGAEGIERLRYVAAQQEDRYAREMSGMVLNELSYAAEAA